MNGNFTQATEKEKKLYSAAKQKLEECFGNKVLCKLVGADIKEIAEDSKYIRILFELKFNDGSGFAYYYTIEKDKINLGGINPLVY